MADVANHLGVSRALASIVFRGVGGASDETRQRVLEAAAELGYRPDSLAQQIHIVPGGYTERVPTALSSWMTSTGPRVTPHGPARREGRRRAARPANPQAPGADGAPEARGPGHDGRTAVR
jgi:Bacterial regulatory proteins, lacI family